MPSARRTFSAARTHPGTCGNAAGAKIQAIVPTKGLQQIDRVLDVGGKGGAEETVQLAVGNNHFCARTPRVRPC